MPQYTTIGGYPNTDPYYISPEEEAAMEASELRIQISDAEAALDRETYEQKRALGFDAPDDADMIISAGTLRKIERVFAELLAEQSA